MSLAAGMMVRIALVAIGRHVIAIALDMPGSGTGPSVNATYRLHRMRKRPPTERHNSARKVSAD